MITSDLVSVLSGSSQLCRMWDGYREIRSEIDANGDQIFLGPFLPGKTLLVNVRQEPEPIIRRTKFATYYKQE